MRKKGREAEKKLQLNKNIKKNLKKGKKKTAARELYGSDLSPLHVSDCCVAYSVCATPSSRIRTCP